MELTRLGDNNAFGDLWARHQQAAHKAAASLTVDHEPEDLVQEAFIRVLKAIRGNNGPREAFRPYLYTVLRSVSMAWKSDHGAFDDIETVAPNKIPAYSFENQIIEASLTGRAFAELSPEWRIVLFYTAVEGMTPQEVAPILGTSPSAVAALAYRAREGLRASWLQAHLNSDTADTQCQWSVERLGKHNRGTLGPQDNNRLQEHLTTCLKCAILVEEIDDLGRNLGIILLPLLLGPAAIPFLAARNASESAASAAQTQGHDADIGTKTSHIAGQTARGVMTSAAKIALITAAVVAGCAAAIAAVTLATETKPTIATLNAVSTKAPSPSPTPPATPLPTPSITEGPVLYAVPGLEGFPLARSIKVLEPQQSTPTKPSQVPVPPAPHPSPTAVPTPSPTASPTLEPEPSPTPSPEPPQEVLAAPVISTIVERGLFLPLISGSGIPGAAVHLMVDAQEVATVIVDGDGKWSATPEAAPGPQGTIQVSTYQTLKSQTSAASATTAAIQLQTPTVISMMKVNGVLQATFSGPEGSTVEAILDSNPTGNHHAMTGQAVIRSVPALGEGTHTLAFRFVDPTNGLHGASTIVNFVVEAGDE